VKALFDRLGIRFDVKFVLYQFTRISRHVNSLPCKDVPIFLEEFGECEFLFGVQVVSHVRNHGGVTREQRDGLVELVLRLDGQLRNL
jgi:hypothetical protein